MEGISPYMSSRKNGQVNPAPLPLHSLTPWKLANPWLRVGAQAVDQGMVAILTWGVLFLGFPHHMGQPRWVAAGIFLWILVSTISNGFFSWMYGNTPGKKMMGLSLQSAKPNHPLTFFQALMRSFVWWLGLLSFGAGWMTVLSRPDRRAWHDLVADTTVVTDQEEISFTTPLQKKIGEGWMGFLALVFVGGLAIVLSYEFSRLRNDSTWTKSSTQQSLERESWLLLAGGPSYAAFDEPVAEGDAFLREQMFLFSKARFLQGGERLDFYKMNMKKNETQFCADSAGDSTACQSARVMARLLGAQAPGLILRQALPGLQILQEMDGIPKVSGRMKFLTDELTRTRPGSLEYLAMKTAQARLFMKAGEFHAAKEALDPDVKVFKGRPVKTEDKFFAQTMTEVSCEAQALDGCRFDPAGACANDPYWRQWASGCQLQTKPDRFSSGAQALGYWWTKTQLPEGQHFEDLDGWMAVKKQFEADNVTDFARDFQTYVLKALDAVLNAKAVHPDDLMGKVKDVIPESPLWGWTQLQMLKEFGTQWAYTATPADQKLISQFELTQRRRLPGSRAVAGDSVP